MPSRSPSRSRLKRSASHSKRRDSQPKPTYHTPNRARAPAAMTHAFTTSTSPTTRSTHRKKPTAQATKIATWCRAECPISWAYTDASCRGVSRGQQRVREQNDPRARHEADDRGVRHRVPRAPDEDLARAKARPSRDLAERGAQRTSGQGRRLPGARQESRQGQREETEQEREEERTEQRHALDQDSRLLAAPHHARRGEVHAERHQGREEHARLEDARRAPRFRSRITDARVGGDGDELQQDEGRQGDEERRPGPTEEVELTPGPGPHAVHPAAAEDEHAEAEGPEERNRARDETRAPEAPRHELAPGPRGEHVGHGCEQSQRPGCAPATGEVGLAHALDGQGEQDVQQIAQGRRVYARAPGTAGVSGGNTTWSAAKLPARSRRDTLRTNCAPLPGTRSGVTRWTSVGRPRCARRTSGASARSAWEPDRSRCGA